MSYTPPAFKITRSGKHFELWEVYKWSCLDRHQGMVIGEERHIEGYYIYIVKPLRISKYRLIRKIQLWAIKKAFN
jgi:hypothetical protein